MSLFMAPLSTARPTETDSVRWQIVLNRQQDDSFFYAVLTTGIVCRPGCSSRPPRRENVRFFDTLPQAIAAGFRPCLRCRPHTSTNASDTYIAEAMRYLQANSDRMVPLNELALVVRLSPAHLQRRFTEVVGVSPRIFAERLRTKRLHAALTSGESATDAVYTAGFSSPSRAHAGAAQHLGMTPVQLRKKASGMMIRYATASSSLGRVLVASTEKGICSIALGASDDALVRELRGRFERASFVEEEASLKDALRQALAMIERGQNFTLPLDLKATAFQMKVWNALRNIPRGETRTYAQVAAELKQPKAVRAVARACGSNPVAIAVPCHRVIGSNGMLTGYRWGVERKRKLLEMESRTTS